MATIITRETGGTAKGTPLTNEELDNNFINLNDDKVETDVLLDINYPSGFLDRTATIAFDDVSRAFSITGAYSYYLQGGKFSNTSDGLTIASTPDTYFIYYNSVNVLVSSTTPWDLSQSLAPVAIVYWDGAAGRLYEERHGAARNQAFHEWAHRTIGTRYVSGLGGTFDATSFSIAAGIIMDEDIIIDIPASTNCVLVYRNTPSALTLEDNISEYFKQPGNDLQYDNNGTLTNVSNNYHVNHYIYATNDVDTPIYSIIGQAQHLSLADAEAESASDLSIPALPSPEFKLIYKVIMKNTATPSYVSAQDLRLTSTVPGTGGTTGDHNALAGLQGGTAGEHYHFTAAEHAALLALLP